LVIKAATETLMLDIGQSFSHEITSKLSGKINTTDNDIDISYIEY